MKSLKHLVILCVTVLSLSLAGYACAQDGEKRYADPSTETEPLIHDEVRVHKKNGEDILLNVELALTSTQQAKGLMGRTSLEKDSGMLFIFGYEKKVTFWMKDTLIPLDMIFIARDGEIHHIHHSAKPQDRTRVTAERDAYAVLEINGGMSEKLGIAEGDVVIHPSFRNDHIQ